MGTIALHNYQTGDFIREATEAEYRASVAAADLDGGAGVIEVDGVGCWVSGELPMSDAERTLIREAAEGLAASHIDGVESAGGFAKAGDAASFEDYALRETLREYGVDELRVSALRSALRTALGEMTAHQTTRTIRVWEGGPQWGEVSAEENAALNAAYERECERRLSEAFPGAEIEHEISYHVDGSRRVTGADSSDVAAVLDAVWEHLCEISDEQLAALVAENA